jgi:hypothetical protein
LSAIARARKVPGDGHTAPAAIQEHLRFFDRGGAVAMRTVPFNQKNIPKLSEIIVEINDLREFAFSPDRPERDRGRFSNPRRLPLTPFPQISKNKAPKHLLTPEAYHI